LSPLKISHTKIKICTKPPIDIPVPPRFEHSPENNENIEKKKKKYKKEKTKKRRKKQLFFTKLLLTHSEMQT
jgi:hypothetical protein